MRWIGVIVVHPDPACLNGTAHAVGDIAIARPDTGPKAIECVIGDTQRLGLVFKSGYRHNWTKDFLLENPHVIGAFKGCRLHIVTASEITF